MAEETNTTVTETNQAENSGGDPKGNADNAAAVSTPDTAQAEKTFTQKELDEIVRQRLDRAKKDMPSKDELKAFKEWQDNQKTAEQRSAEKIAAAESGRTAAEKRAEAAEAKCTALTKGVRPEVLDDVITLAMSKVGDDKTVEQAIDEVIKKHPSFCAAAEKAPEKKPSFLGASGSGGNSQNDEINAARAIMGLPPKN